MAFAFPVLTENDAKAHVTRLKKEYHDARHHCFAYRLGANGEKYRAYDDGEPSGTAGKPILGQLLSFDITDALIVVVRYFGGTLLGTGGLTEAYKLASQQALENAPVVQKHLELLFQLRCPYDYLGTLMHLVKEFDMTIVEQNMTLNAEIKASLRRSHESSF